MKIEKEIPEGPWKSFLAEMLPTFETLLNHKQFIPSIFLGKFTGVIQPFHMPELNPKNRLVHARAIREAIKELKADFVVLLNTGDIITDKDADEFSKNIEQYQEIRNHPNCRHALIVTIETKSDVFQGVYTIEVKEQSQKLEVPMWAKPAHVSGPMTHFFGPKLVKV